MSADILLCRIREVSSSIKVSMCVEAFKFPSSPVPTANVSKSFTGWKTSTVDVGKARSPVFDWSKGNQFTCVELRDCDLSCGGDIGPISDGRSP